MATLLLPLSILSLVMAGIVAGHNVTISLLDSAVARGADGTPPAYAYSPGFGDGVDKWHVIFEGGGWCRDVADCLNRSKTPLGSSAKLMSKEQNGVVSFGGMLDANSTLNPDFYNWHVFRIFYCDGSSFMSDVEDVDPCLFPENLVPDIQTPLFLIESAFDSYQIGYTLFPDRSPKWKSCLQNLMLCNWTEIEIMKDFRLILVNTLKSTIANSSSRRGYFVHSCYRHGHMEDISGSTCSLIVGNGLANKVKYSRSRGRLVFRPERIPGDGYGQQLATELHWRKPTYFGEKVYRLLYSSLDAMN
ncbi:hypothetical protein SASPL_106994 [Salvia splendens]|uniref:Pectin acetylesterase n=1 Tax=Salvia splendens TaxID=180675 RepID=A0A8X8Y9L0_SALSN|nr:hypothetical protein SASPL_106994 [Salvia splendens]